MTGQSLCLTCLHNRDGLCVTTGCGLWWIPIHTQTSCRQYIPDSQTTMETYDGLDETPSILTR